MKTSLFTIFSAVLLLIGSTAFSVAQTTEALVITSTVLDHKGKPTVSKAYLKDHKMVVETGDGKQKNTVMFDSDKETFYMINHKKKEYTEMTREDMEALNAMMQQQLAAMDQQLAMLPEKQREMLREKMGAAFGAGQKPAEYSLDEKGVQVKEWKADKWVGKADGQIQSEIYISSFSNLKRDASDFEAMGKFYSMMQEYMQGMAKSMPSMALGFFSESMPGYEEGMPVKTIMYDKKQEPISSSMLESIAEEEVPADLFSIPDKYKKQTMEGLADNE